MNFMCEVWIMIALCHDRLSGYHICVVSTLFEQRNQFEFELCNYWIFLCHKLILCSLYLKDEIKFKCYHSLNHFLSWEIVNPPVACFGNILFIWNISNFDPQTPDWFMKLLIPIHEVSFQNTSIQAMLRQKRGSIQKKRQNEFYKKYSSLTNNSANTKRICVFDTSEIYSERNATWEEVTCLCAN